MSSEKAGAALGDVMFQVARLELNRGDTLVVKTPAKLSRLQEERVHRQLKDFLGLPAKGVKTLILHSGMEISTLTTTESEQS